MDYKQQLENLITTVQAENASDLHFTVGRKPTIRSRGELIPLVNETELTAADIEGYLQVLLTPQQFEVFKERKEADFSYEQNKLRFRCNSFVQQGMIGIAMRLIPRTIRDFKTLNLPEKLGNFALLEQGFFLVVGPVGHGKTTTLAAMVDYININKASHIVTIEDPIEYVYDQKKSIVDQREVGTDTSAFNTALESVFRQDVDVVLVGEMRDAETMATAVTAGETGHLVLSTLHTNDAPQTIDRIIDSFPAEQQQQIRGQLAASLTGIFSQRLVPGVSGEFVPAYELLLNNNAVRNLIREDRVHEISSVIETGQERGMISLNQSLIEHVRAGRITMENAKRFSLRPELLDNLI